ncbi:MAG: DUF3102 domain-containing protein [Candidatus Ventricola sp.]
MDNAMTTMQGTSPARSLIEIEAEILAQKRTMGRSIVIIGQALREAKGQLAHGEWGDWIRDKVNFSQGTAENYMRIAEQVSGESMLLDLPYTKILALLSVPEEDREQFAQDNQVEDKSVSEIKRLIAERDEARKSTMEQMERADKLYKRAERAEEQIKAERRDQERLTNMLNREREHVAELMAREPDTVTIEREVLPADYEEIKADNEAMREELDALRADQEDARDPLAVVPFCDACAALLGALFSAPYAKDFFATRSDAELERYSTNINLVLKWAMDTQDVVDSIRADRAPDDGCFKLAL